MINHTYRSFNIYLILSNIYCDIFILFICVCIFRCLKLSYNTTSRLYSYQSDDCGARHRYACKLSKDDESANKIEKTARMLMNE